MLKVAESIAVCHQCPNRGPLTEGKCACLLDPERRDIIKHAEELGCPENKFPKPDAKPKPPTPEPREASFRIAARGAAGIAKAVLGAGGASLELIESRTEICKGCEHAILSLGVLSRCKLCGCATWAKVRNATEKCPAGKW